MTDRFQRTGEGGFEAMIVRPQSRILRKPEAADATLSKVASPYVRKYNPVHVMIHSVTFVGSLLALGYFSIVNFSTGAEPSPRNPQGALQSPVDADVLERQSMIVHAVSPATLATFYNGALTDPDNPIAAYQGPVLAEDGSGPLPVTNGYGAPTAELFDQDGGGWGVPD